MTTDAPSIGETTPTFKASGAAFSESDLAALTSMRIERGYNTVSRATLRFADAGFAVSTSQNFAIGKEIAISDANGTALFAGEVTSVALDQSGEYIPELVVVADDHTHRLSRTALTATYLQMSASQVIDKLARATGLTTDITSTSITFDYLIQGGTALDYVDLLASRAGLVWFCEYPKKLKVCKPDDASGTELTFDLDGTVNGMRNFSVRASARNIAKVTVTGWDLKQTQAVEGKATTARTQESNFVSLSGASNFGEAVLTRSDLSPLTQAEATTLADALNKDASSQAVHARGTVWGNADVAPGIKVQVANAGPASGKYLVTEVEHRYDSTGFWTTFTAGSFRREGLVDLLITPESEPGFNLEGVITGVVTNVVDPDNLGRCKVKFPSIPGAPESEWARVVTVGGGPDRGALFLPEVDDEVLVAFERDDTRRPVVLGGLFSTKNALPGQNPVKDGIIDVRRLTSRTANMLELSDAEGKEYVLIQHGKKKHEIRIENDKITVEAKSAIPIKLTNGQATIEMKDNGDILIDGNKITIKGKMDVELQSDMNVKAKGNLNVQVEATAQLQLKGTASADLQAGGVLNLKGAKVGING